MNKILLAFSLLAFSEVYSQSTIIHYNYQNESFSYFKVTKKGDTVKTKKPYGYKDVPTKVVVNDLNTFYYGVNFEVESRVEEPIGGDKNMESLSENFTDGAKAFGMLVDEVKSNDIYQSLWKDGKFQGMDGLTKAFGAGADQYADQRSLIETKAVMLEQTQELIAEETNDIRDIFMDLLVLELVNDQLEKLQKNKDLGLSEMQARAAGLITKVMDYPSLEQVVMKWQENSDELMSAYSSYKGAFERYKSQKTMVLTAINEVKSEVGEGPFEMQLEDFEREIDQKYKEIEDNLEVLGLLMKDFNSNKIKQDYLSAYEAYDRIAHADFDFEYTVNNKLDVTTVKMEFVELSEDDTLKGNKVLKTRTIEIPTMGGLRINSSAGMSFIRHLEGHQSYNSEGGTVNEVNGDAFLPALTTMFHFYRQTPRPFALGGAFGVSIPIEGDKDFIYMMGTSLIVGKMQRVIVNLGAFGGKIDRLNGLRVGDVIPDGSIVPTKKVFDMGIYAGVTFNISSLF